MNPVTSNRIVFVLSLAGFGLGVYLTLAHFNVVGLPCTITHGCEEVNNDPFAKGLGIPFLKAIPTASFGGAMYLVIAMLSMMRAVNPVVYGRGIGAIQLALSGLGLLVFAYLTYREAFVIQAWCQWCIATAVIDVIIFIFLMAARFAAPPQSEGARA